MQSGPVFEKELTYTDINHRLCFPTTHMDILPPFAPDKNEVRFDVRYGDDGPVYTFWCIKRQTGGHLKPTIDRGWSDVVHNKQLQIGDRLQFYVEGGQLELTRYRIEVRRHQLEHSDDFGETWNWIRI